MFYFLSEKSFSISFSITTAMHKVNKVYSISMSLFSSRKYIFLGLYKLDYITAFSLGVYYSSKCCIMMQCLLEGNVYFYFCSKRWRLFEDSVYSRSAFNGMNMVC